MEVFKDLDSYVEVKPFMSKLNVLNDEEKRKIERAMTRIKVDF